MSVKEKSLFSTRRLVSLSISVDITLTYSKSYIFYIRDYLTKLIKTATDRFFSSHALKKSNPFVLKYPLSLSIFLCSRSYATFKANEHAIKMRRKICQFSLIYFLKLDG